MSMPASPRPWRAEQPGDECRFWTIRNPDGVSVCTAWREADAALIVDAVNERDRLRDELEVERSQHCTDIEQAEYHEEHHRKILEAERDRLRDIVRRLCDLFTVGTIHPDGTMERLLREAREAIGEGKQ